MKRKMAPALELARDGWKSSLEGARRRALRAWPKAQAFVFLFVHFFDSISPKGENNGREYGYRP